MVAWQRNAVEAWRRSVGAGVVTAGAALAASLLYLLALTAVPLRLSADAQYWVGYAPQFAFLAGLVVGTAVWRRLVSSASTPERGAVAGIATALGIVVLVPVLAGLYVSLFPLLLGVVTGQELGYALRLYPALLWTAVDVVRTVAGAWSPLVGALLVPFGALVGWVYQRSRRPGGR